MPPYCREATNPYFWANLAIRGPIAADEIRLMADPERPGRIIDGASQRDVLNGKAGGVEYGGRAAVRLR